MWATASVALRLQSSSSRGPGPAARPDAGARPAADMATVAVPSTNVRREMSGGSDTIAPQRLTHAMNGAAAVADHRHLRIVYGETFGAASRDEVLARCGHQHALLAQCHDIGAQLHGIAVGNRDGANSLRAQPL